MLAPPLFNAVSGFPYDPIGSPAVWGPSVPRAPAWALLVFLASCTPLLYRKVCAFGAESYLYKFQFIEPIANQFGKP